MISLKTFPLTAFAVIRGVLRSSASPISAAVMDATKLLSLILNHSEKEWVMPPREWAMAKVQFAVIFGKRFVRAMAA